MATPTTTARHVSIDRPAAGQFTATNDRGGVIEFGTGAATNFTPVELLLAAIGGCTAIDVDIITSRRAEPDSFVIDVTADKVRDDSGNRVKDLEVSFRIRFPAGQAGDAAREVLPAAVARSHERLCTVGRTVELGTPITPRLDLGA